jgi:hypothetical protein
MLLRARKTRKNLRKALAKAAENELELESLMSEAIQARQDFQAAICQANESQYQKFYLSMDKERERRAAPTSVWDNKGK